MSSFEQDHQYLLEFSNIFKPTIQYSFDYTFASIDSILDLNECNTELDGPAAQTKEIDDISWNWYTQYWFNCTLQQLSANLDGYEFCEICNYNFEDDKKMYTGHFLDHY